MFRNSVACCLNVRNIKLQTMDRSENRILVWAPFGMTDPQLSPKQVQLMQNFAISMLKRYEISA